MYWIILFYIFRILIYHSMILSKRVVYFRRKYIFRIEIYHSLSTILQITFLSNFFCNLRNWSIKSELTLKLISGTHLSVMRLSLRQHTFASNRFQKEGLVGLPVAIEAFTWATGLETHNHFPLSMGFLTCVYRVLSNFSRDTCTDMIRPSHLLHGATE
jgi:hypothetical protein